MSTSTTAAGFAKQYYTGAYPADHWALQPYELSDPKVVAIGKYKDSEYALYLNPRDKRGYRCIACLIKNDDMASSLNRDFTDDEYTGLALMVELVEKVFRTIVPVVQTFKAGNNAHVFDPVTRIFYLGHEGEPVFLHTHLLGRGHPENTYVDNVPLDGPKVGTTFDMMGKTASEPGNDRKVVWGEGQMAKVANVFKSEIEKCKNNFTARGLTVETEMPEIEKKS